MNIRLFANQDGMGFYQVRESQEAPWKYIRENESELSPEEMTELTWFHQQTYALHEVDYEPIVIIRYPAFEDRTQLGYYLLREIRNKRLEYQYGLDPVTEEMIMYIPYSNVQEEMENQRSIVRARDLSESEFAFTVFGEKNGIIQELGVGHIDLASNNYQKLNITESEIETAALQEYLETNKKFAEEIYILTHETAEFQEEGKKLAEIYRKARNQYNQGMELETVLEQNHIHLNPAPAKTPRRYDSDGTRLWNGKRPQDFTMEDTLQFLQERESDLASQIKQTENREEKTMVMVTACKVNLVNKEESSVKAICDIELNNIIQLYGIRIIEGQNGPFVSYPAYKVTDPAAEYPYREYMHFADKTTKDMVSGQILKFYQKEYFNRARQRNISVQCTPLSEGGNVKAIATVSIDEMRLAGLRVMEGKEGLFVAYPSVPDPNSKSGYTDLIVPAKFMREQVNTAVLNAYQKVAEKASEKEKASDPEKKPTKKQTKKPAAPKV